MSKIKLLNSDITCKSAVDIAKKIHLPKSKDVCSKNIPNVDVSTEELGFFMYNGKVVNIIYPR